MILRSTFYGALMLVVPMLMASLPAMAADAPLPDSYPRIVWPDPTPAELAILPKDGCKHLFDIKVPDRAATPPNEYSAWQYTDDAICWDWYKKHVDKSYLVGETPPPGTNADQAALYSMSEEQREAYLQRRALTKKALETAPAGTRGPQMAPR